MPKYLIKAAIQNKLRIYFNTLSRVKQGPGNRAIAPNFKVHRRAAKKQRKRKERRRKPICNGRL